MSLILRNLSSKLQGRSYQVLKYCTVVDTPSKVQNQDYSPIISTKEYSYAKLCQKPRQVWIENLDTIEEKKLGLIQLHPDVFAAQPRIDIIHMNLRWQRLYRHVTYNFAYTRAELRGGGRKPWPQKGMGRARHASIRSPLWKGGGIAHGPRSPTTYFYMIPFFTRVKGLTSMLSVKLAQDDLHIIKDLELPGEESSYITELIEKRNWGPSVLFVDTEDYMPRNIIIATQDIKHVNLMPLYGLNVYSMLKYNTLVLTERAARSVEEKLLFHLNRIDTKKLHSKFRLNQ